MGERRIQIVDALRGFAIFGILVVNLPYFATTYFPGTGAANPQSDSWIDTVSEFVTSFLFESKFFILFALLFGYSFVLQQRAAERGGDEFVPRMLRRSLGLFAIGAAHAILFWFGDILTLYAVLGLILLACRNIRPRTAVIAAAVLLGVVTALWLGLTYVIAAVNSNLFASDPSAAAAEAVHAGVAFQGSFGEEIHQRIAELVYFQPVVYLVQGPIAMAMMLLGYAAAKVDVFENLQAHRKQFVRLIQIGLPVGLLVSAIYAYSVVFADSTNVIVYLAMALMAVGAPLLMGSYVAMFTLAAMRDAGAALLDVFAPVGRMALSNYVFQSVVLGFIFYGYGFGLVNGVEPHEAFVMALAVFAAQVAVSHAWMEHCHYGPLEWILRAVTNLELPPFRKPSDELATSR